jgi:hypothetical protein
MDSKPQFYYQLRGELLAAKPNRRRSWPNRHREFTVLGVGVAMAAVLAATIIPNISSNSPTASLGRTGSVSGSLPTNLIGTSTDSKGLGKTPFQQTVAHPLPYGQKTTLDQAATTLGASLPVPTVSGYTNSDLGPVWANTSTDGDTGQRGAGVALTYPASGAIITYSRPAETAGAQGYRDAVDQMPGRGLQVVALSDDAPALYIPPQPGSTNPTASGITFVDHGTQVDVTAPGATKATVIAIANSIALQL